MAESPLQSQKRKAITIGNETFEIEEQSPAPEPPPPATPQSQPQQQIHSSQQSQPTAQTHSESPSQVQPQPQALPQPPPQAHPPFPITSPITDKPPSRPTQVADVTVFERDQRRDVQKNFNSDPVTRANRLLLVNRSTYVVLLSVVCLVALAIIAGIIWFNVSLGTIAGKDFGSDIPVTVNDQDTNNNQFDNAFHNNFTFNAQTQNSNQHTIQNNVNVTVILPEELIVKISNST